MNERGSAVVEFVALALVLTVPVAFAATAVLAIVEARAVAQSAATAAALAVARDGGGRASVERVARSLWDGDSQMTTDLECAEWCSQPGGSATVTVTIEVAVPFVPHPVTVSARQTQVVDRYGAQE